jgi:hypothetical protein
MVKYRIKPEYLHKSALVTNLPGGGTVNLLGKDLKVKVPATSRKPETERVIRGATQKDLEVIYTASNGRNPFIEKYEDKAKPENPA